MCLTQVDCWCSPSSSSSDVSTAVTVDTAADFDDDDAANEGVVDDNDWASCGATAATAAAGAVAAAVADEAPAGVARQ